MKRAFIAVGLLIGLALLSVPAEAQYGTAKGKVVDTQGNGVPDVDMVVDYLGELTLQYELKTTKNGDYIQAGLTTGRYRFTAKKEGFAPAFVEHRITLGGRTAVPDIILKTMDEIAIEQGRPTPTMMRRFTEGVKLANAGKYDEAEALFKQLQEEAPNVPEIYQNLAFVYVKQKDWSNAEASFLKTLELRPGDSQATSGLASVYMETGREEEAQELVSQAIGDNPEDAAAQFNRAVFLVNSGETAEAIPAFEAALASDPTMAEAHFHLGTLLVGQGKIPEALQHLETYLSMDPKNEQNIATANGLIAALKK
jgi:tetratricopeptide (TPR) repeat protein